MAKISIVMPVYNAERYLEETLASIQKQTFSDFEVICVNDGSTDGSADTLNSIASRDSRFIIVHQENMGAARSRNNGFAKAAGDYVIFLDSDDLFHPQLLEKLYRSVTEHDADIAACNFSQFDPSGKVVQRVGIHSKWLAPGQMVFNWQDCPDHILSIINPTPWNKLYHCEFLRRNGLKFEELRTCDDITFAAVSVAAASKVAYSPESLVSYRIGNAGTISSQKESHYTDVICAVTSAIRQALALPHSDEIRNSIYRFAIENYLYVLKHKIVDFSSDAAKKYYDHVHNTFNEPAFTAVESTLADDELLLQEYITVKRHDHATIKQLMSRKLIVSVTSYPARIGTINQVFETIFAQTHQPDDIQLWLAEEQFPNREADLPEILNRYIQEDKIHVHWCDDIKPHKKYFYVMQENPEAIVVTIDDDVLYPPEVLYELYRSYLQYPDCISTARGDLILVTDEGKLLPYNSWLQSVDSGKHIPSMHMLAIGCAGILYPPGLLRQEFFNKEAIMKTCLFADDLWLKVMEVMCDVPTVVACKSPNLQYVPGSQGENALWRTNVIQQQNDVWLANIFQWMDEHYGEGVFYKKLTQPEVGADWSGVEAVSNLLTLERNVLRRDIQRKAEKLEKAYQQIGNYKERIQLSWDQNKELRAKLAEANARIERMEKFLPFLRLRNTEFGTLIKKAWNKVK